MKKMKISWNLDKTNLNSDYISIFERPPAGITYVAGIVGVLDQKIVEASNPKAEIGIVVYAESISCVYVPNSGKFFNYENMTEEVLISPSVIEKVIEYINNPENIELYSGKIDISKIMSEMMRLEIDNEILRNIFNLTK